MHRRRSRRGSARSAAQVLAQTEAAFQNKFNRLKTSTLKQKTTNTNRQLKLKWSQDRRHLQSLEQKYDAELQGQLKAISPEERPYLSIDFEEDQQGIQQLYTNLFTPLKQLRRIIKEHFAAVRQHEEKPEEVGIVRETLANLKEYQQNIFDELKAEAAELSSEIGSFKQDVWPEILAPSSTELEGGEDSGSEVESDFQQSTVSPSRNAIEQISVRKRAQSAAPVVRLAPKPPDGKRCPDSSRSSSGRFRRSLSAPLAQPLSAQDALDSIRHRQTGLKDLEQFFEVEIAPESEPIAQNYFRNIEELDALYRRYLQAIHCESGAWGGAKGRRLRSILALFQFSKSTQPSHAQNQSMLMEQLRVEFPEATPAVLQYQIHAVADAKRSRTHKRTVNEEWNRKLTQLKQRCKAEVLASNREAERQFQKDKQMSAFDLQQTQLAAQLERLRKEKEEADRETALLEQRQLQRMKQIEEKRKAMTERQRQLSKVQLAKYMQAQADRRKQQLQRDKQRAKREAEIKRRLDALNKERVEFRDQRQRAKVQALEDRKQQEAAARLEQQKRLEALARTVGIEAKVDPARILQPTKAFESLQRLDDSGAPALFSVTGYNSDQLMADPRFKLQTALAERGLTHSSYAQSVLRQTRTRIQPRPDQFSRIKFGNG